MPEFLSEPNTVDYLHAIQLMKSRVKNIEESKEQELIWFLEHPSLYTAGTSSKKEHLLNAFNFPVFEAGRGGQYTYHGPGQLVVYCMIDLRKREKDVKKYVWTLEQWIIDTLLKFNILLIRRKGRVGLWYINSAGAEAKIAAIGVRISKWITWHGFSININPNLDHFNGIVPCGIKEYGVTSCVKENFLVTRSELEQELQRNCPFN
jgi:lipoyl(octanoyl) transferase